MLNGGRTAPVCAEFFVLSHRFISFCLLFLYGIPAAIGPAWHRHDVGCGHVCAQTHDEAACDAGAGCVADSSCVCDSSASTAANDDSVNLDFCLKTDFCPKAAHPRPDHATVSDRSCAAKQCTSGESHAVDASVGRASLIAAPSTAACSICAFYAQAQAVCLALSLISATELVDVHVEFSSDAGYLELETVRSRGPPTC